MTGIISFAVFTNPTSVYAKSMGHKWPDTVDYIFFTYPAVDPTSEVDAPMFTTAEHSAVDAAFRAWNTLPYSYSIPQAKTFFLSGSMQTNNVITKPVSWGYPEDALAYTEMNSPNGIASAATIKLNRNYTFSAGIPAGTYHLQSLIMHELGHVLGIAHCHEKEESPCSPSGSCELNIMNWDLPAATMRTTFRSYDINSYISIYQ